MPPHKRTFTYQYKELWASMHLPVDISVVDFSGSGVGGVGGLGGGDGGFGARFFSRLRLACLFLARASDALTYKILCNWNCSNTFQYANILVWWFECFFFISKISQHSCVKFHVSFMYVLLLKLSTGFATIP